MIRTWTADAGALLSEPSVMIPVVTVHPLWLACIGEVASRRSQRGLPTVILDLSELDLYDPERESHAVKINRIARFIREDSLSRLRRYLTSTEPGGNVRWTMPQPPSHLVDSPATRSLRELNMQSESSTLFRSRFGAELLTPAVRRRMEDSWNIVYTAVSGWLDESPERAVLVFNGRFVNEGAARAAAKAAGTNVYAFERGYEPNSMVVMKDNVHDPRAFALDVERVWRRARSTEATREAEEWFRTRAAGPGRGGNEFSRNFRWSGPLFSGEGRKIALFTSSADEFDSIEAIKVAQGSEQLKLAVSLIEIARAHPEIQLGIRLHPHLAHKHQRDQDEWSAILGRIPSNVIVYQPGSSVSSYQLALEADLCLTFGSTIGAEAAFQMRPVVELVETQHSHLGIVRYLKDLGDLTNVLTGPHGVLPGQREQAIKYAYWLLHRGEPLDFASLEGLDATIGKVALEPFGRTFRSARRLYWRLQDGGLPLIPQSRHGAHWIRSN